MAAIVDIAGSVRKDPYNAAFAQSPVPAHPLFLLGAGGGAVGCQLGGGWRSVVNCQLSTGWAGRMAERGGFEPPVRVNPGQLLSRQP